MRLGNLRKLSYEELAGYANNFCESNYVGHFQFGKFYRGMIVRDGLARHVMVKIWEVPVIYTYTVGDNERRLFDEVHLLRQEMWNNHPGLVKLYGYCFDGDDHLGVVYEFDPFDSVYNLVPKDGFTWLQRLKAVLGFASLLKYLHNEKRPGYKPFIVRNLDCLHLVLDKEYNPKLCDFGLITGGIFPDRTIYRVCHINGAYGYIDLDACYRGVFSVKQDVFAFGAILLSLISKRVYTEEDRKALAPCVCDWAWSEFGAYYGDDDDTGTKSKNKPKFSLVHQSFESEPEFDPADGHRISVLAIKCIRGPSSDRPCMNEVLKMLLNLKVVQKHADFLGVKKVRRSCGNMSVDNC